MPMPCRSPKTHCSPPPHIEGRAGRAGSHDSRHSRRFRNALQESLEPYFDVCGEHVAVREAEFQPDTWREPWFFLSVSRETETVKVNSGLMQKAMEAANQRGCSRIIVHAPRSAACCWAAQSAQMVDDHASAIVAQHIIRERLGACGLPEDA